MRLLYFLLLVGAFFRCNQVSSVISFKDSIPENYYPNAKTADKNYPYFDRYIERSYPSYEVDAEAYAQAKEKVHAALNNSQKRIGFDDAWKIQGPTNLGGRVSAIAVHPTDENIMFIGYTTGGLYKTVDGGLNWIPVFDDKPFLAIGEVTIDPMNPETVYVGTGDPIIGGLPHIGDGAYKSTDGGNTWDKLGLEEQRIISSIAVDKDDPNRLFASSLGMPFFKGAESRGIFSSEDGGETWVQSYSYSDSTGFKDVVINPEQSNYIYATGWDRVRRRNYSVLRGEGSTFYLSRDGGANWEKDLPGLPQGRHCKAGMAICENQPQNVYVMYVAEDLTFEGMYRSEDYGESFSQVPTFSLPSDELMSTFGWFFGHMAVNPDDPNHILISGIELWETRDGGQNWNRAMPPWFTYDVHADCHEVIFSGDHIYLGTDGGAYKRRISGGETDWTDIENIPTNLFYRVAYNPHNPSASYGGMQDNGTSGGSSNNQNWPRLFGGDGFSPVFDPIDPNHYFFATQNGRLYYTTDGLFFDLGDTGFGDDRPWDTPYLMSQHSTDVMYAATDQVYQCNDSRFPFWEPISDQIYSDATGLSESAIRPGIIYASFANGTVMVTESFGLDWENINDSLPDKYPTSIKASPEYESTAYITYSGYREFDNQAYVFKTDDFGQSWTDLTGNLPDIPVNDILVIPNTDDQTLFVASDVGVYGTIDGGETWDRVGADMPMVIVNDLEFNPQTNLLIAGTFGKSIMSYALEGIVPPTSTADVEASIFNLRSNVVSSTLELVVDPSFGEEFKATLIDNQGQLIRRPSAHDTRRIDVSSYQPGVYYLRVVSDSRQTTKRFVKI